MEYLFANIMYTFWNIYCMVILWSMTLSHDCLEIDYARKSLALILFGHTITRYVDINRCLEVEVECFRPNYYYNNIRLAKGQSF